MPILDEYAEVLARPKFPFQPRHIEAMLRLARTGQSFFPAITRSVSSDEDDNRFLELAETASSHYLVTGNKRHFPRRWRQTRIVNARELLGLLATA